MIFSSLIFLCAFLPVTFCLYYILPGIKSKNILLIITSLIFYAYGEPIYVLLMLFSTVINFFSALIISKSKQKKAVLVLCIVINLGILCLFKYSGFIVESINGISGLQIHEPEISLPIGISFFTFQALSYVIDVYKEKVDVQTNYANILLYVSFFPQLIAGPIVKYRDINKEIISRKNTPREAAEGFRRFICGLSKKIIIANTMGQVADIVFATEMKDINIVFAWLGAISYMLQIYFDFSGYSDMAIGLGKMFGFHFKENFNYPYNALSIQDFWRRWHISLSTWFKEYLYIPLGGNRKGKIRTCVNKFMVFFFTGLWHGANWTFVVWGLYHGFFLLLEEWIPLIKKLPKFIVRAYTLIVVCIGFVIFRADTIEIALSYIAKMFTFVDNGSIGNSLALLQLTPWCIVIIIIGIFGSTCSASFSNKVKAKVLQENTASISKAADISLYLLSVFALVFCIIRLSGSTNNPFLYFRF